MRKRYGDGYKYRVQHKHGVTYPIGQGQNHESKRQVAAVCSEYSPA